MNMKSWPERARWVATTWLLAWVVGLPIGILFSATGLVGADPSPLALVGMSALSIVCAILLRRHWQSLRSWISQSNDWLLDHPATTVGIYALMGMFFSLLLGLSLVNLALGGSLRGRGRAGGTSDGDRRRRGDAAA